jgi:hypothetical protein
VNLRGISGFSSRKPVETAMRGRTLKTTSLAAAVSLAALATAAQAGPVRIGETQGLGLLGASTPDILQKAKDDPYAPPAEPACRTVPAEIDALNAVLGPDADQPQKKTNHAAKWVGGAIRGLIPHRDVIRFLTGAGKKDDALKQAAMAGWARRGYLKGLAKTLDCVDGARRLAVGDIPPLTAPPAVDVGPLAVPPLAPQVVAGGGGEAVLTATAATDSVTEAAAIGAQPVNR